MKWFKLHSEFCHDPKLATFTKSERYDIIHLLCLASENQDRGMVPLEQEDIAAALGLTRAKYADFEAKLERKSIATRSDSGLEILNWEKRQYEKPSNRPDSVAERVRNHRERVRNANPVTCNAPETRSIALDTDTDTDTDTEKIRETPSASKKGAAKQKTQMTEDWLPTDEAIAKAAAAYPSLDISEEIEKFRNYWLEKDEPRADWLASFRNWLINAKKFAAAEEASSAPPPPRKRDRIDEIAEELGMPGVRMSNFTDPRIQERETIAMVERNAAAWGVSYEEAAERVMVELRRDFPKMSITPIPPRPSVRQGMTA